ncbi:hypothetical protein ScPMuIL_012432 [Solemya velum]
MDLIRSTLPYTKLQRHRGLGVVLSSVVKLIHCQSVNADRIFLEWGDFESEGLTRAGYEALFLLVLIV